MRGVYVGRRQVSQKGTRTRDVPSLCVKSPEATPPRRFGPSGDAFTQLVLMEERINKNVDPSL